MLSIGHATLGRLTKKEMKKNNFFFNLLQLRGVLRTIESYWNGTVHVIRMGQHVYICCADGISTLKISILYDVVPFYTFFLMLNELGIDASDMQVIFLILLRKNDVFLIISLVQTLLHVRA